MKKILFAAFTAAMVGVSMTSCSNEDEMVSTQENIGLKGAISWKAGLNNPLATRGTAIAGTNYLDQTLVPNMQVWGFFTPTAVTGPGIAPGQQYVGADGAGIVIKNFSTEDPVSNMWDYNDLSEVAYWPTQPLNFYAIIPAADASFTVTNAGTTHNLAKIVADVTIPTTITEQKDILFAQTKNQSGRTGADNAPVAFTFDHALTQVVFKGKLASSNLSADIESITVCGADQKGKVGYLTDDDNNTVILGSQIDASHTVAKFAVGLVDDPTLSGAENVSVAKNLIATDGALMMLPQSRTADKWDPSAGGASKPITGADTNKKTYLAISCKIKNGSAYVMGDESAYETVYIPFEIDWLQGKKYTYTLVFGKGVGGYDENGDPISKMLPITYTVSSVTDWAPVDGGEIDF